MRTRAATILVAAALCSVAHAQAPASDIPNGQAPTTQTSTTPAPGAPDGAGAPDAQQQQQVMMQALRLGAYNQLGILEYCQSKGAMGSDVVDIQKRLIGKMPPVDVAGTDQAEDTGKSGTLSVMGQTVRLADAAKQQGTSEQALCGKMATLIKQNAAQIPQ